MTRRRLFGMVVVCGLTIGALTAQDKKRKSHAFRGKVEAVNESTKSLTVNHERVEGYMEAMTMAFEVDKPEVVLKKVKVGDRIKATVYDDDYKLYDVQVEGGSSK